MEKKPTKTTVTDNKTNAVSFKEVKGTPFHIAKSIKQDTNGEEQKEYCVTIGAQAVTPMFPTKEDALNYINEKPWQLICAVAATFAEYTMNKNNMKK